MDGFGNVTLGNKFEGASVPAGRNERGLDQYHQHLLDIELPNNYFLRATQTQDGRAFYRLTNVMGSDNVRNMLDTEGVKEALNFAHKNFGIKFKETFVDEAYCYVAQCRALELTNYLHALNSEGAVKIVGDTKLVEFIPVGERPTHRKPSVLAQS